MVCVYCSQCGKKIAKFPKTGCFIHFEDTMPFGSKHDGKTVSIDLCAECADQLVEASWRYPIIRGGRQ